MQPLIRPHQVLYCNEINLVSGKKKIPKRWTRVEESEYSGEYTERAFELRLFEIDVSTRADCLLISYILISLADDRFGSSNSRLSQLVLLSNGSNWRNSGLRSIFPCHVSIPSHHTRRSSSLFYNYRATQKGFQNEPSVLCTCMSAHKLFKMYETV